MPTPHDYPLQQTASDKQVAIAICLKLTTTGSFEFWG